MQSDNGCGQTATQGTRLAITGGQAVRVTNICPETWATRWRGLYSIASGGQPDQPDGQGDVRGISIVSLAQGRVCWEIYAARWQGRRSCRTWPCRDGSL